MVEMWSCFQQEMIDSFINEIFRKSHKLTMWQQHTSERVRFYGEISSFSDDSLDIAILQFDDIDKDIIDGMPIYIYCEKFKLLFKKELFSLDKDGRHVRIKLPHEVRLEEKRIIKRFYYKYQDFKEVDFHSVDQNPCDNEAKETIPVFTMNGTLVDISTDGIGIVITKKQSEQLSLDGKVVFTKISDQIIPPDSLVGTVTYFEYYSISGQVDDNFFKVGISFEEGLETVTYNSIKELVSKKQTKCKGLDTEGFHGLDYNQQQRMFIEIEVKNKVLARKIKEDTEYLDKLRYLTTQMKKEFMLEVNKDLLATSLRTASKELIYELLIEVSENAREEMLEKLNEPRPASAINKAQELICDFVRKKESLGDLVLDPTAYITYV